MKKIIRLTESDLHRIVKESVKKILREIDDDYPRLSVERNRPGDIPPGDEDIHYPGDVNPDVLAAVERGDYGDDDESEYNDSGFDTRTGLPFHDNSWR